MEIMLAGLLAAGVVIFVLGRDRTPTTVCWCAHRLEAHEHYRTRTDCSLCPCLQFRTPRSERLRRRFW